MTDTILDTSATTGILAMNGTVSGTIEATPLSGSFDTSFDHDWYAVSLTRGHVYSFSTITTSGGVNDVAIDLSDASRNILNIQGVVDGGTNRSPNFAYMAGTTGTFYLAVSAGGSNPASLTGNYALTASDLGARADTIVDSASTSANLTIGLTAFGAIEATPMSGSFDMSIDHDWFAVNLMAGHHYTFSAVASSGAGLPDVAIDLSDANRNILNSQGVVDGGTNGTASFTYTAPSTGIFYLAVGAGGGNPANTLGFYQVNVTDSGSDTVLDTSATTANLTMNGMTSSTIDATPMSGSFNTSLDHDWFAVNLIAGHK